MTNALIKFYQHYAAWDPMLVRQGSRWLLYVMAAKKGVDGDNFFTEPNHIHGFCSSNLSDWTDLGVIIGQAAEAGRLCAGYPIVENERVYFFFSSTITQLSTNFLDQRVFLATTEDGEEFVFEEQFSLLPTPELYPTRCFHPEQRHMMFAWRDPFCFRDPNSGKFYLFICCGGFRWGVPPNVAVAVADCVEGPYRLLPPAIEFPVKRSGDSLVMPLSEIERAQVHFHAGQYFMTFATWERYVNKPWFRDQLCANMEISDSTTYVLVANRPEGPYRFHTAAPLVTNSERTGLYGTMFVPSIDRPDSLFAIGWHPGRFEVEVTEKYPSNWADQVMSIDGEMC